MYILVLVVLFGRELIFKLSLNFTKIIKHRQKLTRLFNLKIQLNYTINQKVYSQRYGYIQFKQQYISANKNCFKNIRIRGRDQIFNAQLDRK